MILFPFPTPPPLVAQALTVLEIARDGDPDTLADLGDTTDLPRPWDPPSCPEGLRHQVWLWCDDVAAWVNHEYGWRPSVVVPSCWPRHPHLARELPVLACLRVAAGLAVGPDQLEDWHRQSLPYFLERMAARLGDSGCRTGRHTDWPAAARYDTYTGDEATTTRLELFYADTHRARPLRSTSCPQAP